MILIFSKVETIFVYGFYMLIQWYLLINVPHNQDDKTLFLSKSYHYACECNTLPHLFSLAFDQHYDRMYMFSALNLEIFNCNYNFVFSFFLRDYAFVLSCKQHKFIARIFILNFNTAICVDRVLQFYTRLQVHVQYVYYQFYHLQKKTNNIFQSKHKL